MSAIRRAFTLVELIVVIAIIAVLIGLLIPAVQQVRNAAARMSCQNKMKQIGTALHTYHDTHRHLPSGCNYKDGKSPQLYATWLTQILPQVEQESLHRSAIEAYKQSNDFGSDAHEAIRSQSVKVFECPADPRSGQPLDYNGSKMGMTSYLGVWGDYTYEYDPGSGCLFTDSAIHFDSITDGTSNTLMVGERPPMAENKHGWWYAGWGRDKRIWVGDPNSVLSATSHANHPDMFFTCPQNKLYRFSKGKIDDPCDGFHFWSLHMQGANFLFADGSVRFLPYSAADILPDLATRAGSETVEIP